ncbi:MAG: DUF937 domain-containing protein [Acidobacteria bacterium]|nr:DUF937 domain-containing protein [Acidobacteriota bacterium]
MSSMLESLAGQLGGDFTRQVGQQVGVDSNTVATVLSAGLPMLLGGLSRNAANPQGAEALFGALQRDHDGGILDMLGGGLPQNALADGMGILGHVFGGRQSALQNSLGRSTGIDAATVGRILAMAAPIVLGYLGRMQRQKNLDPGGLSDVLGREARQVDEQQPGSMGMLNSILDSDGDGDVDLSDMLRHGAGIFGKFFGGR